VLRAALAVPAASTAKGAVRGAAEAISVEAALATVRDRRPLWDDSCISVEPIESSSDGSGGGSGGGEKCGVAWDVVEQRVRTPGAARLLRCCLGLSCGAGLRAEERLVLLRAWRVQGSSSEGDNDGGVGGGQGGERAVFASRSVSVAHRSGGGGGRAGTADVSPSCWCLTRVDPHEPGEAPALAVEYAVEFEYGTLQRALPGFSDARIVSTIAAIVAKWFVHLPAVIAAHPK